MWIVEAQHGERKSFIYVKIVLSPVLGKVLFKSIWNKYLNTYEK